MTGTERKKNPLPQQKTQQGILQKTSQNLLNRLQ